MNIPARSVVQRENSGKIGSSKWIVGATLGDVTGRSTLKISVGRETVAGIEPFAGTQSPKVASVLRRER